MKKFKMAPHTAKRMKAIIAAAMALTMAVPTSVYFSSKEAKAEAEETVSVPDPVMKLDFEKGFAGESKVNGLSVVKSEEVLKFKEYKTATGDFYLDPVTKAKICKYTDVPFVENKAYKKGVLGNQPVTAYDVDHGSVLMMDDTVKVQQFIKKASDELDATTPVGVELQKEVIAQSQVKMTNPFAGKTLTKENEYGKGVTISYWVKYPDTSNVNQDVNTEEYGNLKPAANLKDSSLIVFNNTSRVVMNKDDRGKYEACVAYDKAKAANDTATLADYSLGTQKNVTDASGKTYTVYEKYGKLLRLNPEYQGKGYYIPKNPNDGKIDVTDAEGNKYKIASFMTDGTSEDKNQYDYYRYFYAEKDDKENEYSKDSKIRRDTISGSMQISAQDDFHFREDMYYTDSTTVNGVPQIKAYGTTVTNPNSAEYGKVQGYSNENQFFFDGDETVTNKPGVWHYVTVVIQNDWVDFYVDGEYKDPEDKFYYFKDYSYAKAFSQENIKGMFNEGKGLRGFFAYPASNIKDWSADGRLVDGPYNKYGITMLDWLTDKNTELFVGGNGVASEAFKQTKGTVFGTMIDDLTFYDAPLSKEQAEKAYQDALVKMQKDESVKPQPIAEFKFDDGTMNSTDNSNSFSPVSTNLKGLDPSVVGGLLKTETSKSAGTSAVALKTNPFAGKDLTGATVSYWIKMSDPDKSPTITFLDEAKVKDYEKMSDDYRGATSSSIIYVDSSQEAWFMEAYTTGAYYSIGNKYQFSTTKNQYTEESELEKGGIYDPEAAAKKAEYLARLAKASEWHYITTVFTNYEIQIYYDGQKLNNNQMNMNGLQTGFGPRFFDGYYARLNDDYGKYYKPSNNQGGMTLMSFLTDPTTSAYIGYRPALGSSTRFEKGYESYYDNIAYYDVALTEAQAKVLFAEQTPPNVVVTPTPAPTETVAPTPGPLKSDDVTEKPIEKDTDGYLKSSANGVAFKAAAGVIPDDARLSLGRLGTEASADVYSAFKTTLGNNKNFTAKDFIVYTVTAKDASGKAITANGKFSLTFDIPSGYDAKAVVVVGEDGTVYEGTVSADGTKITISTDKFGKYAVVQKDMSTDDGSTIASAASKSGKTGDTANVAIPFVILALAGTTLVVSYKKKAFQK